MRIQANTTMFQFPGNENVVQKNQAINEVIPKLAEQPVKVSISEAGYQNYRSSIVETQSYDEVVKQKELLTTEKLSTDLNYDFRFKIWETLSDEDIKMSTDGNLSFADKVKGRIENIAETYASLYDEIVQGYENGTRKINVVDNESEQGYRTLTMEEEISALDKAYEKAVNAVESIVQQQPKFQKAYAEYREKLEKIGAGRAELADRYTEQSQNSEESMPEDIYEKMISARDSWKSAYAAFGKDEAWKSFISMFGTIFQ